ncbi:MAG: DUF642 domain-containing protein [Verrucomicrobiae bacterium]|nr:DUF642 domain-containing protein [Verrucomicrobiae bacterium]MCP5532402.1 DUF642 domain-containing protein [Akkermansiaceae bacterium]MCP5542647.1 DUF642 domain-containing protein [Akkermansiaceae bacterium]MCP5548240.1 DUF642 domain-containing protein [Akkermansiaceae bacterium]
MKLLSLILSLGAVGLASSARAANIIDSIYGVGAGSFELPGHGAAQYETLASGDTDISGWIVDPTTIDWVKDSVWNASDGSYSIDLNGSPSGIGGIHTVIPTTAGTTYRVTFDIAAFNAPGSATDPKTMDVNAGGTSTSFSLAASHSYSVPFSLPLVVTWHSHFVEFTATGSSATIGFLSTVPGDGSAMLLDNVSVEAVPETSGALLAALGLLVPLMVRRRSV